jgi:hypothetical protein
MSDYAERVARGAALLDGRRPGWAEAVDLDELELSSCQYCVLGQLYGDFYAGRTALGLRESEISAPYGFDIYSTREGDEDFEALAEEWRKLIRARRTGGAA